MNRKTVFSLVAIAASLSVVGGLAVVAASHGAFGSLQAKASAAQSITWTKDTGVTATTASGNEIAIGSRYLNDWTFGGDYFASSSSTNAFIDNFTNGSVPFRQILSFTVEYAYTDKPLFVSLYPKEGYTFSHMRAQAETVVSGKKYEVGSEDLEYLNCTKEDTFRWFSINHVQGSVDITSFTIEYVCA